MVTFITSDGEEVQVPVAIATEIGIVSEYYDGDLNRPEVENADLFPLPNDLNQAFSLLPPTPHHFASTYQPIGLHSHLQ